MILSGKVWKVGRWWAIECPALDAATQGHTKKDALAMMVDWVRSMLDDADFEVAIKADGTEGFVMSFADPKPVLGLMIAQARTGSGMTLDELAKKLGLKSRSNVAHYESGKHAPSLTKAQELLDAMGYEMEISIRKRA